jgi:hypothetical protein
MDLTDFRDGRAPLQPLSQADLDLALAVFRLAELLDHPQRTDRMALANRLLRCADLALVGTAGA